MNNASNRWHDLDQLLDRVLDGLHSEEDSRQLNEILRSDVEACRRYVAYMELHGRLTWGDGIRAGTKRGARGEELVGDGQGMAGSPAIDGEAGFGIRDPGSGIRHSESLSAGVAVELPQQLDFESQTPEPPFPTLSTSHYPLPTSHFSVGSWAFSYMVATVIMGVAILGFWAYKITHHQHVAEAPSQSAPSDAMPEMVFVGRITGMVDVKWSDDPRYLPPPGFAHVPLGREYRLDSGLLEITYDSGAKVILQGPCTYEVESTAGGYLSLGKLTARVGEDKETKRQGDKEKKADAASPHLLVSRSPGLPVSPLFSVRTPTAVITDLGTEFGVEVSEEGATESRVFRGSVRVEAVSDEGRGQDVVLRKNESARVEGGDEPRITVLDASVKTVDFTRRIPKVTYKRLDLVDVVAGGDGFSGRRGRSIDPTNGQVNAMTSKDTVSRASFRSDGKYHRVEALPLVDGVFIPDGRHGPVRVDSADNMFAGFPNTCNATWKPILAIGAIPTDLPFTTVLGGIDYAAPPHCLLFMHANNGITFDLEAIRRANPSCKLLRFRAVAGSSSGAMSSPNGVEVSADLWVLVDGQVRFERRDIDGYSGAFRVLVSIGGDDRFLTLATTDGGNKAHGDWTMFGDPRLDLMHVDANEPKDEGGETMNGP